MLGLGPRFELAVGHHQINESACVALFGGGIKQRGSDIVAVRAFRIAPDLGAVGAVGDHVRLSPLLMDIGRALADLEGVEHVMSSHFGAGLVDRAASANRGLANQPSSVESAETDQPGAVTPVLESAPSSRTANNLPAPTAATRTATLESPSEDSTDAVPASLFSQRPWVYVSVAAGVLLLLALWLQTQPNLDDSLLVYARTPSASQAPAAVASTPSPETIPTASPQATPVTALSGAASATSASSVPSEAISQPAPEPTPAVVSQTAVTNVPPAGLPPKESPQPDFRLNGIFYTVTRPSAILNGTTVRVGDVVNGATVIDIGRSYVTLVINGQPKTCALR